MGLLSLEGKHGGLRKPITSKYQFWNDSHPGQSSAITIRYVLAFPHTYNGTYCIYKWWGC